MRNRPDTRDALIRSITRHPAAGALLMGMVVFLAFLGCQKPYTTPALAVPTPTFTPVTGPTANCAEVPKHDLTGYVNRPVTYIGDTSLSTDRFSDTTFGSAGVGAPDDLFIITVFSTAYYTFSMCGPTPTWDSYMALRTHCDDQATDVSTNDDACGTFSMIQTTLTPGVYYLIVDGLGSSDMGAYQLKVTAGPTPVP